MEVNEAKVDLFVHQSVEPEVKIEPSEDIKDLANVRVNAATDHVPTSASLWSFLVKRARYLHQTEHGISMNQSKLTRTLLQEVQQLLNDVSGFVRMCCDQHSEQEHPEECIALSDQLAQGLMLEKGSKLLVSHYQGDLFLPFKENKDQLKNEIVDLDSIQLPSFATLPSLQNLNSFTGSDDDNEDDDDEDDDMDASFDNSDNASNKFAQYPRPKIVPVDYNKKKQVCVCEQCGGSWSRKEYYYHHKSVGKCTPKWIRYSAKNKNRIRCVHPDCESKKDVNFTYAGIMKHIIELHTSQETATLQCPDCDLKFPMKAVLKFHQDSAHQAHAMICTICGKIVRDMRKHKLVHSGEKPFQCDRCSYRCSRSGTLRRHMATHLNSDPLKANQGSAAVAGSAPSNSISSSPTPSSTAQENALHQQPLQLQQQHMNIQVATTLEQQIPIHIAHHESVQMQEPKYIELTTQQLAQHLPPHTTYNDSPSSNNLPPQPSVSYREFKFP